MVLTFFSTFFVLNSTLILRTLITEMFLAVLHFRRFLFPMVLWPLLQSVIQRMSKYVTTSLPTGAQCHETALHCCSRLRHPQS